MCIFSVKRTWHECATEAKSGEYRVNGVRRKRKVRGKHVMDDVCVEMPKMYLQPMLSCARNCLHLLTSSNFGKA